MRRRFFSNKTGEKIDLSKNYLNIEALEDVLQVGLDYKVDSVCEYCIDNDIWKILTDSVLILINKGQTVSFRGNLTPTSSNGIGTFRIYKKCNVKGNIMSLLYGDDFEGQTDLTGYDYVFHELFFNCYNIVDASELILPATTLANSCYKNMFVGCHSLTTAPVLPATTLTSNCYSGMFGWCASLITAPELPATTLASDCYNCMFEGCTSLTTTPELPATTLAYRCYYEMFNGCTSLTTAHELPATTLTERCYYHMFNDCTSLTTAPELPATTLANYCYNGMFYGCSNLNYIKMLATDISASNCLSNWVHGVANTGIFAKASSMTSLPSGSSGIPRGWTVINIKPTNSGGTN